jgi:transketolase
VERSETRVTGAAIRRIVLEQSHRAHVGHIGSALSIADIIAALYGQVLNVADPLDLDRDRFILSKGHAALALYAAVHLRGWISLPDLNTYCGEGTLLGVHPEHALAGVDFSSGSLGQGLSIGCGAALAARMQGSRRRVFVVVSDAECNEGAVWEAAMFAAHHRLSNLTVIVDSNGQQALGYTNQVLDLSPLSSRWQAFGWETYDVDGHDIPGLVQGLLPQASEGSRPRALVAKTTFGKGVSFMESLILWHYLPMSDAQYAQALAEIDSPL